MKINVFVCSVFRDSATPSPFRDHLFDGKTDIDDNYIYLEGVLAGWGCCCLQVTFQAQSLIECLYLYDQLLPLAPIMVNIIDIFLSIYLLVLVSIE